MNNFGTIFTRLGLGLVWVSLITSGILFLPPKLRQMYELEAQRNERSRSIDYKKSEIEALKIKQQRFSSDPDFIEYIARQGRLIHPNEVIFIVEE